MYIKGSCILVFTFRCKSVCFCSGLFSRGKMCDLRLSSDQHEEHSYCDPQSSTVELHHDGGKSFVYYRLSYSLHYLLRLFIPQLLKYSLLYVFRSSFIHLLRCFTSDVFLCLFQDYSDAHSVLVRGRATLKLQTSKPTINMKPQSTEVSDSTSSCLSLIYIYLNIERDIYNYLYFLYVRQKVYFLNHQL